MTTRHQKQSKTNFSTVQIKKIVTQSLAAAAAAVLLLTSAHAALVGRDINGVAVAGSSASAVFLYDTDLNITWLRNANAGAGSSFDDGYDTTDGLMTWGNANNWANTLTVGSYSGWRLPTMVDTGAPGCDYSEAGGTDCGTNVQTASSEMAHLYYVSLGNLAYCPPGDATCAGFQAGWGLNNVGNFQNLQPDVYWSGTEYAPNRDFAWYFYLHAGQQYFFPKQGDVASQMLAMAVRPGDVAVAPMPEPGTLLLAALALAGMRVVRRRRPLGISAL